MSNLPLTNSIFNRSKKPVFLNFLIIYYHLSFPCTSLNDVIVAGRHLDDAQNTDGLRDGVMRDAGDRVFAIIFGLIALIFPGPTMLSLVLLLSAYMLVDGIAGTGRV